MGRFSSDAIAFADQMGMTLVDGPELLGIIGAGLAGMPFEVPLTADTTVLACPGAVMVHRTASRRRGVLGVLRVSGLPGRRARSTPSPSAPLTSTRGSVVIAWSASVAAATMPSVGRLAPVACLRVHRRDRVGDP